MFTEQTSMHSSTMQNHSKQAPHSFQLFKKQRLRFNPTFSQQQLSNKDEVLDDDDASCSAEMGLPTNKNDEFSVNFADTMELPAVASEYSCFMTSQQCVNHLLYLLDEMECPDYGFPLIMEWAHICMV
jgi:hypothetical protein